MVTITSGATGDLSMTQKFCHFSLADTADEVTFSTIVLLYRVSRRIKPQKTRLNRL